MHRQDWNCVEWVTTASSILFSNQNLPLHHGPSWHGGDSLDMVQARCKTVCARLEPCSCPHGMNFQWEQVWSCSVEEGGGVVSASSRVVSRLWNIWEIVCTQSWDCSWTDEIGSTLVGLPWPLPEQSSDYNHFPGTISGPSPDKSQTVLGQSGDSSRRCIDLQSSTVTFVEGNVQRLFREGIVQTHAIKQLSSETIKQSTNWSINQSSNHSSKQPIIVGKQSLTFIWPTWKANV